MSMPGCPNYMLLIVCSTNTFFSYIVFLFKTHFYSLLLVLLSLLILLLPSRSPPPTLPGPLFQITSSYVMVRRVTTAGATWCSV